MDISHLEKQQKQPKNHFNFKMRAQRKIISHQSILHKSCLILKILPNINYYESAKIKFSRSTMKTDIIIKIK